MAQDGVAQASPIDERDDWLIPLVVAMRDRLRTIELSRFWQLRNAFFALKHRLGFSSDSSWKTFEVPARYEALLAAGDAYAQWRVRHDAREADVAAMARAAPVIAPRTYFEITILDGDARTCEDTIRSLRAQAYPYWSLAPNIDAEFCIYVRSGDRLAPDALFALATEIARDEHTDIVYSDQDSVDAAGRRFAPNFKASWSPETLLSRNYIGDAVAYRRSLLDAVGPWDAGLGTAAAYDLALRASERARSIVHVPRVLYHRSVAPMAPGGDVARRAVSAALERRGERGNVVTTPAGTSVVRYSLERRPRVSILLPTRDHADDLQRCLGSLFERTTYRDFELLLIDNGSKERAALDTIDRFAAADDRLRVLRMDVPFNYSRLNNAAAREATGEIVVLLNNDTEIVTPDWLEALVEQALRPQIGAVGANLVYPDGRVQHGGVVLGIGGVAGHSHRGVPGDSAGYFSALQTVTNYSAVTAACLAVRKELYDRTDGLDEALTVAFNDVDFCLRLGALGYRCVWLPHVVLRHGESLSRGSDVGLKKTHRSLAEQQIMLLRWGALIDDDPYYNPHLTRLDESFAIRPSV